ncbi:MAG: YidC/Oxa1 family insertase periplasmic-domain containing protein [Planctomycetota bacterium]
MDSRFFLTIVVCFLVATLYLLALNTFRTAEPVAPAVTNGTVQRTGDPASGGSAATPTTQLNPESTTPTGDSLPAPSEPENRTVRLTNSRLEVVLEARAAAVIEVRLTKYQEDGEASLLPLISPGYQSGSAFVVVAEGAPRPPDRWNWVVDSHDEQAAVFRHDLGDGRELVKRFRLREDEHLVDLELEFRGSWAGQHYRVLGPERIRLDRGAAAPNEQVIAYGGPQWGLAEVVREHIGLVPAGERTWAINRRVLWSGLESNFFAYALRPVRETVPESQLLVRGSADAGAADAAEELNATGIQGFTYQVGFDARVSAPTTHRYEIFMGPKDREILARYPGQGYGELVYYGKWLGPLVRVFLALLQFFFGIFGSYGIAIICLTVVVKACLYPINRKNQTVMMREQKKMAKIQPQIKELKERHKNDPLKANREIQKMMKEHNVNPAQMAGGCLLMFLQLPIWICLITTFRLAIELRHTPFLYITDLTQPDRLFQLPGSLPLLGEWFNLLPFLYMGVTVVSQKMQPKATDPQMAQQQKIMMFMMVAFGFIFYSFSSGLLLYFLTSASLGIVEQKIIRRRLEREGVV